MRWNSFLVHSFLSLVVIFCVASGLSLPAAAQNGMGSLRGEVQDAGGGRIASAAVTLKARDFALQRMASANDRGEFRFDDLLPGVYTLSVSASGFAEVSSDARVMVSVVRDVLVTLRPAPTKETVNVHATASSITTQPIDTTSAVHGGVVTAQDLQTIPLADRSFANIAYLVPGTEPVEPSDPTKARITAVSFGGSSGLNDAAFGGWRGQFR